MIFAIAALALSATQDMPVALDNAAQSPTECELHIWPAKGTSLMHHGIWDSFQPGSSPHVWWRSRQEILARNDGGPTTSPPLKEGPMPTDEQIELLKTASIPALFNLPQHKPVFHDAPLDSLTIRTQAGKYAENTANCYADVVVNDVVYARVYGKAFVLKSFIRFRNFGSGATAVNSFGTWVETKLEQDPRQETTTEVAIIAELRTAYSKNFELFAEFMTAASKKAKKSH